MACWIIDVGGAGACHGPGRTTWRHSSGMTGFCGSTLTVTVNGRLAGLVAGSSSLWYTKAPAPVASTSDIARDNHLTAFSVASREASACVIANVTANTLTLSSTMASHGRWFSEMMAATPPESAATPAAARSLFMDRQEACFPGSGAAPGDDRPPAGATGPAGGAPAEPGEGPAGDLANPTARALGSTASRSQPASRHALACPWVAAVLAHHVSRDVADGGRPPTNRATASNDRESRTSPLSRAAR